MSRFVTVLWWVMKAPFPVLFFACVALAARGESAAPAGKHAEEPEHAAAAKPGLHPGMTADEIIKLIGKPQDVKTIATPAGKGEAWTYRRIAKQWTERAPVTTEMVPTFAGSGLGGDGIRDMAVPAYRTERITVYQVTSLLLVDGKMVTARQWPEKDQEFE